MLHMPLSRMWLLEDTDDNPWRRHQMKTFSALLAIGVGTSPVIGDFPPQRPVTWSFGVFFDLHLNKRLSKQSLGWWYAPATPVNYGRDNE